eukprot:SAG31_NODE_33971_length_338_cov_0.790795_2_plen_66_part_01
MGNEAAIEAELATMQNELMSTKPSMLMTRARGEGILTDSLLVETDDAVAQKHALVSHMIEARRSVL